MEHFGATGEPAWEGIRDDIEVQDHDILDAADYRGHAGFGRWLADWGAAWSEYSMETEKFPVTGRGSGVTLEREDAMVFEVRDGEIARLDYYNDRKQALAAGLDA